MQLKATPNVVFATGGDFIQEGFRHAEAYLSYPSPSAPVLSPRKRYDILSRISNPRWERVRRLDAVIAGSAKTRDRGNELQMRKNCR